MAELFVDDIFKNIFCEENVCFFIHDLSKFVPKDSIKIK